MCANLEVPLCGTLSTERTIVDETLCDIHVAIRAAGAHCRRREEAGGPRRDPGSENAHGWQPLLSNQPVRHLIDHAGIGMEDSQLICAYLDSLDDKPRFHHPLRDVHWDYRRLEASARSMCEGICVWVREMTRPESERSPAVLAHEVARSQRMADFFEARAADPLMQAEPGMAHLTVAVSLDMARKRGPGDLTTGRPRLTAWMRRMSDLPAIRATALP
jgi:hypothetical protein